MPGTVELGSPAPVPGVVLEGAVRVRDRIRRCPGAALRLDAEPVHRKQARGGAQITGLARPSAVGSPGAGFVPRRSIPKEVEPGRSVGLVGKAWNDIRDKEL